jgi:dienelactone hydrolase
VSEPALWVRQRGCWDRAVTALGGERISIPYAHTALPGYFFPAASDTPRPLVVIDHGGRHATSHALALGGAAAAARGFHWMTFDGPGRQEALFRNGLVLRPDWEAVLTPIADAMAARSDVDAERIAIIGVEHAAYGVARGLAFEHRFAAAVTAPGVVDASTLWTDPLPAPAREALFAGDRRAFNREIHLAGLFDPRVNEVLRQRGRWYGLDGREPYDLYDRVRRFRLGDETRDITTPVLVRENVHERLYPGQAGELYARLPGPKRHSTSDDPVAWIAERMSS